jgi:hypothetical protein
MAKATELGTTALSVSEAATAIVGLINSRAHSPWPQEIEAIIAKVAAVSAPQPVLPPLSPDHLKYREIIAEIARFDEEGCPHRKRGDA